MFSNNYEYITTPSVVVAVHALFPAHLASFAPTANESVITQLHLIHQRLFSVSPHCGYSCSPYTAIVWLVSAHDHFIVKNALITILLILVTNTGV